MNYASGINCVYMLYYEAKARSNPSEPSYSHRFGLPPATAPPNRPNFPRLDFDLFG